MRFARDQKLEISPGQDASTRWINGGRRSDQTSERGHHLALAITSLHEAFSPPVVRRDVSERPKSAKGEGDGPKDTFDGPLRRWQCPALATDVV